MNRIERLGAIARTNTNLSFAAKRRRIWRPSALRVWAPDPCASRKDKHQRVLEW
jgi:hypothetical protein